MKRILLQSRFLSLIEFLEMNLVPFCFGLLHIEDGFPLSFHENAEGEFLSCFCDVMDPIDHVGLRREFFLVSLGRVMLDKLYERYSEVETGLHHSHESLEPEHHRD